MKHKDGFNPTKEDLLTIEKLLIEIKQKKGIKVNAKIKMQEQLTTLKSEYDGVKYKGIEFFTIKAKRIKVKEKLITIDLKIRELNIELSFKNTLKLEIEYYLKHNRSLEGKEDLKKIEGKLRELKKKYKDFAKDRTRIASLRIMASELTEEIDKILEL
jgi:hypothetical protein